MNPIAELRQSFEGWSAIVRGLPDAAEHFRLDTPGFLVAAGWFLVAVLLSVAAQSAAQGMPGSLQLAFGLFVQAVTVGVLWLVVRQTLAYLKLAVDVRALMVPALYALAYMFSVAIPLALFGPLAQLLAVLGVAALMFFAGRTLAGMSPGAAVAFAALCLMVLVIVPNALYIVFLQLPLPA